MTKVVLLGKFDPTVLQPPWAFDAMWRTAAFLSFGIQAADRGVLPFMSIKPNVTESDPLNRGGCNPITFYLTTEMEK